MTTKTKVMLSISSIFLIFLLFILVMQWSTNSIMKEVEKALLSTDYYVTEENYVLEPEKYQNPKINYIIYDPEEHRNDLEVNFNLIDDYNNDLNSDPNQWEINLDLVRMFAWHNFFDGTIWFYYSVDIHDENGKLIFARGKTPYSLKIHRNKDKWIVTDIHTINWAPWMVFFPIEFDGLP